MGIGDYKGYQYETNMGFLVKHLPSGIYLAEYIKKGKDDAPRALTPEEKEKASALGFAVIREETAVPEKVEEEPVEEKKEEENPMLAMMTKVIKFMEEKMPGFKEKTQEEKVMQAMTMINNAN